MPDGADDKYMGLPTLDPSLAKLLYDMRGLTSMDAPDDEEDEHNTMVRKEILGNMQRSAGNKPSDGAMMIIRMRK